MKLFERYDPSKVTLETMEKSEYLKMMEDIKKAMRSPDPEEALNSVILDDLVSRQIAKSLLNSCEYFINDIRENYSLFSHILGNVLETLKQTESGFRTGIAPTEGDIAYLANCIKQIEELIEIMGKGNQQSEEDIKILKDVPVFNRPIINRR